LSFRKRVVTGGTDVLKPGGGVTCSSRNIAQNRRRFVLQYNGYFNACHVSPPFKKRGGSLPAFSHLRFALRFASRSAFFSASILTCIDAITTACSRGGKSKNSCGFQWNLCRT
jgi:hypothetical protein